jgi:hypothetical protein
MLLLVVSLLFIDFVSFLCSFLFLFLIRVGTTSNSKCTGSVNSVVAGSCGYLSTSATTWFADGNYQTTIGGVSYAINILSYTDPQTSTLAWKLIVVGEGSMPTSNYMPSITAATTYSITDIKNRFTTLETIPQFLNFFSGSSMVAPLTNNIVQRTNPSLTGITQQALWLTYNVFKSLGSSVLVRNSCFILCFVFSGFTSDLFRSCFSVLLAFFFLSFLLF